MVDFWPPHPGAQVSTHIPSHTSVCAHTNTTKELDETLVIELKLHLLLFSVDTKKSYTLENFCLNQWPVITEVALVFQFVYSFFSSRILLSLQELLKISIHVRAQSSIHMHTNILIYKTLSTPAEE